MRAEKVSEFRGRREVPPGIPSLTAAPGAEGEPSAWPDPQPLGCDLPPVKAFELSLLAEALRAWVADIAERMQVPLDAPAVCAVVALAGCVSRRAVIQPKAADTSFQKVPNLWGGIVLPSGFLKSPVLQC